MNLKAPIFFSTGLTEKVQQQIENISLAFQYYMYFIILELWMHTVGRTRKQHKAGSM